jgi:hypothetical protein
VADHLPKSLGHLVLLRREIRGPAFPGAVDRPRLDQVGEQLGDEEGVTAGLRAEHIDELRGPLVEWVAGGRLEQRADPALVEAADAHCRRPGVTLKISEHLRQRMIRGELRLAIDAEDDRSQRPLGAKHVAQHEQRRSGRPVQVVEHEQGGLHTRRGLDQRGYRFKQGVALGFGVAAHGLPQRVEFGQQPRELRSEAAELGAKTREPDRFHDRAQRLDPWLVRHGESLVAAPIEHERPLLLEVAGELRRKPGLADARLARTMPLAPRRTPAPTAP